MLIRIFRYDPLWDESYHYDDFIVPPSVCKNATVMDILRYISCNLDPSLGFFRHSRCNRGVCKRCLVRVNGKVVLSCNFIVGKFLISEENMVVLEPVNKKKVVKDLLVENL